MSGIQSGDIIAGRYRIAEQLGAGGMAQVFRADDMDLGRSVAIKVLASRYARDPQFVDRFRREASSAAKLNHPNIVQVFDRGEAKGTYYIVMEYLPGPDLKDIIRRRGAIGADETIEAGLQILSALAVAHRNHVVHRDIKPQNVIMADDGLLKVTDFGIAQAGTDAELTEAGSVIGTAQYLSPEQAQGGDVTGASDCYSVGIVLYEMLTGRVPFDGERPVTVAMKQVHEPPVPPSVFEPSVPPALEQVVLKAMAKRPADRFASAEDFSAALMSVRAQLDADDGTAVMAAPGDDSTRIMTPVAAPAEGSTRVMPAAGAGDPRPRRVEPPPPEHPPRRPLWPYLVALAVLLLVAGVAYLMLNGDDKNDTAMVTVPAGLVGISEQDATTQLIAAKLKPESERVADPKVPEGQVISVDPAAGRSVPEGSQVVLTVSSGPANTTVPNVVTMKQADAVATIRRAKLEPKVQQEFSADVAKGVVISQSPSSGAEAAEGDTVTIVVSKGTEPIKVPNVRAKSLDTALSMLQAEGLKGNPVEVTSEQPKGMVLRQDPAPGTEVQKGATVRLEVAAGPQLVSVPSVVGSTRAKAVSVLEGSGFEVSVQTEPSSSVPSGSVIRQDPGPNEQRAAGSTITIVVSDGPASEPTTPVVPAPAPGTTAPSPGPAPVTPDNNAPVPAPGPTGQNPGHGGTPPGQARKGAG